SYDTAGAISRIFPPEWTETLTLFATKSDRLRLANLIQAQIPFSDADRRPACSPRSQVSGFEMQVERLPILPSLLDMNEATIKHVLRVGILQASGLRSAALDHG